MGGDGGVIASNRKYMRGAGSADQTADHQRHQKERSAEDAAEVMSTCFLTKARLHEGTSSRDGAVPIVACPFGRLYHKEAAVQALLRRKTHGTDELGHHVRGMSDLYPVSFQLEKSLSRSSARKEDITATCPITNKALTGSIPAVLLVPGNPEGCNVVSESALSKLPPDELLLEYGPITRKVQLAPNPAMLEQIQKAVEKEHAEDAAKRKAKKSKKKGKDKKRKASTERVTGDDMLAEATRNPSRMTIAVCNGKDDKIKSKKRKKGSSMSNNTTDGMTSSALSALFTTADRKVSEKEKKDNLFAR